LNNLVGHNRFLGMTLTSLVAVHSNIHPGPNLPGQVTDSRVVEYHDFAASGVAHAFREECSASDKMSATTFSRKFNSFGERTGQYVL